MPIYLMQCTECSHTEDKLVMTSDTEKSKDGIYPTIGCSKCNEPMKKQTSFGNIHLDFKGEWFKTKGMY